MKEYSSLKKQRPDVWTPQNPAAEVISVACKKHSARYADAELRIPAEREAMKPFVIGRKNWLFANTRKGLDVSCAMYSLTKTAIHNGLDAWAYMKWLISELPHKKKDGFV